MNQIYFFLLFFSTVNCLELSDIVVTILSQADEHHAKLANNLKLGVLKQAELLNQRKPVVHLSHAEFGHIGDWTILPIIPLLADIHGRNASWLLFVQDNTQIQVENLRTALDRYDHTKPLWLGHAVYDREASIIHHFAFHEDPKVFKYPLLASGVAISIRLIEALAERSRNESGLSSDFGIDAAHEMALFVWNNGKGEVLIDDATFCTKQQPGCGAFPVSFQQCDAPVPNRSIFFAVKTCKKFHSERVPIVKKTWAKHAAKIAFFSDHHDDSIPTVLQRTRNVDKGHCMKTMEILRYASEAMESDAELEWVVVADDDTVLGVSKMRELLSCYNSSSSVALGERFGYKVFVAEGYNYITGGGGMVFSKVLVRELVTNEVCKCPELDAPDDMFLGICIFRLGVTVTHSPMFHQARPDDYTWEYLESSGAVSFHKHWMIDPIEVYNKWFLADDLRDDEDNFEMGKHNEL